ncbi:MAG: hypothetical protein K0R71_1390 [Bacillales bacterium]|nr:hypothetical protein [Bacillales bacterium]
MKQLKQLYTFNENMHLWDNFKYVMLAIVLWNIIVFLIYGYDKKKSIKNQYRVSENKLLTYAFLMGGIGAFSAMEFFHHKTKKWKFRILVPIAIVFNILFFLAMIR